MGIYEKTPQGAENSIGIPYVDTLIGLEWYRHKSGWTRYEEIYHTVRTFDTTTENYGDKTTFC